MNFNIKKLTNHHYYRFYYSKNKINKNVFCRISYFIINKLHSYRAKNLKIHRNLVPELRAALALSFPISTG